MILLFADSIYSHLKEIEGEHILLDFDNMTGELFMTSLKTEKHIKLQSNVSINNLGRYVILKDENSLFILKDEECE